MTRLVVRRFSEADTGKYKCSKGSDSGVLSDDVYLMMRPRLLADFPALEHIEEDESADSSVVTGHRRQAYASGLERPTGASPKPPKKYIDAMFQPVVIDPAELGVAIENDSQK
ncbi:unnamed protein product [Dibothriocephalus latus]|uniref:Immunoglobulin I-set domain-containing protein n=1 Tax=Dibothriocephalus latus TaxID=60516 RepID=A0A3P7LKH5_DIBLA|nr:unnamed protein product [Dibothriocephalus latus]